MSELGFRKKLVYKFFPFNLDEVGIVHTLIGRQKGTMLDVGAHWGNSLAPFLQDGWTVYAFEPDPANRAVLNSRHPGARVDARAISEKDGETVSLFTSDVSTGISTLSPFHPSHEATTQVQTVRLDTFIAERGIDTVDFIKTDVEGLDLFVLRTFPWERLHPKAVVCEFEDNKTTRLGYTVHDTAQFLADKGYAVVVSQWEPVVEYGRNHTWSQFKHYPADVPGNCHGNLIAVQPQLLDSLDRTCAAAARKDQLRRKTERLLRIS